MDPQCLNHHNPPPMEKQKLWGQDSGWADLQEKIDTHHAVKNKQVTVQGPVKKPQLDYMSHRGFGGVRGAPPKVPTGNPSLGPTQVLRLLLWVQMRKMGGDNFVGKFCL